jgi:ABC-type branched-subunit amino acid transport system substrate-binding protein
LGPAITDNALAVRPLVDRLGLPCINYTGSEKARSEFMFQYQVGSLEEEPYVIARHLATRRLRRVVVAYDDSVIGRTNAAYFEDAAARHGVDVAARTLVSPDGRDAVAAVAALSAAADALVYLGLGLSAHSLSEALSEAGRDVPVVANASLLFGYARRDWARAWEGWAYVDVVSEDNPTYAAFLGRWDGREPAPTLAAAYDMGRLIAEGLARSPEPTRAGLVAGLERVKQLPSALGEAGTVMGFGPLDRAALKGPYLVVRAWRGGRSVKWSAPATEAPTTRRDS